MQGQFKKKPVEQKHFEEPKFHDKLLEAHFLQEQKGAHSPKANREKKQPKAPNPIITQSMSEGPMLLSLEQGRKIEQNARIQYEKVGQNARIQYEKALRLEIEALKRKKKMKARPQKTMQKKKQSDEPPPKK